MKQICMLALCCLLLTACTSPADTVTSATPSTVPQTTTLPVETVTTVALPVEFTIYTPNEALDGFVETEVEVEELSALSVVQKLIEAGVLNEDVTINSKIMEDSHLSIDLNTALYEQLVNQGSTGERFLMGSVVNTFLNAFDAETLSITVNSEILESGHVVYDFPLEQFE